MPTIRRASLIMFYCVLGLRKQCLNLVKVCFFSYVIFSHDAPHLLKRVFIFFPFFVHAPAPRAANSNMAGKYFWSLPAKLDYIMRSSWKSTGTGCQVGKDFSRKEHTFSGICFEEGVKQGTHVSMNNFKNCWLLCVLEQFSKQLTVIDSLAAAASSSWSLHHLWSLCTQVERSGRRSRTWY